MKVSHSCPAGLTGGFCPWKPSGVSVSDELQAFTSTTASMCRERSSATLQKLCRNARCRKEFFLGLPQVICVLVAWQHMWQQFPRCLLSILHTGCEYLLIVHELWRFFQPWLSCAATLAVSELTQWKATCSAVETENDVRMAAMPLSLKCC